MEIYDINGKLMSVVFNENLEPGLYESNLGDYFTSLSSSIYFIRLRNDLIMSSKRVILLK